MKVSTEKAMVEDFDKERAKIDFVYFATHCLIDARTDKPFEWSSAQIELTRRITEYKQKKGTNQIPIH